MFILASGPRAESYARGLEGNELAPPLLTTEGRSVSSENGLITVRFIPGRGPQSVSVAEVDENVVVLAGYVRTLGHEGLLDPPAVLRAVRSGIRVFGGQYLIVVADSRTGRVEILTTLARLIPGYYSWTEEGGVLVSSRQAVLASILGKSIRPQSAYPFLSQGYVSSEQPLFDGLNLAASNSSTALGPQPYSSKVSRLDSTLDEIGQEELGGERVDALASALTRAFVPVTSDPVRVGLTGGRDSRLVAAALHSAGQEFSTFTMGIASDPLDYDVSVGRMIAEALGSDHKVVASHGANQAGDVKINLSQRLANAALNSDFSVFGYESIAGRPRAIRQGLSYNGGGGELLRVAYGKAWESEHRAMLRLRSHGAGAAFAGDGLAAEYNEWLEWWIQENRVLGPAAMLKKFSLLFRTGRWGSGLYSAAYHSVSQRPFYDNEVLREALPVRDIDSASDVLYYEILMRLAPHLTRVPFGTQGWSLMRSDRQEYRDLLDALPGPLGDSTGRGSGRAWNWRKEVVGPLGRELLGLVSAARRGSSLVASMVNEDALTEMWAALVPGSVRDGSVKRLWATAALAMMGMLAEGLEKDILSAGEIAVRKV